jgi:hypothetical protein
MVQLEKHLLVVSKEICLHFKFILGSFFMPGYCMLFPYKNSGTITFGARVNRPVAVKEVITIFFISWSHPYIVNGIKGYISALDFTIPVMGTQ